MYFVSLIFGPTMIDDFDQDTCKASMQECVMLDDDPENVISYAFNIEKNAKIFIEKIKSMQDYIFRLDQKLFDLEINYRASNSVDFDSWPEEKQNSWENHVNSVVREQIQKLNNVHYENDRSFDEELFWLFYPKISTRESGFKMKIISNRNKNGWLD